MSSALSSSMNRHARSLFLVAKSRLQSPFVSSFRTYAGSATRYDSSGYSGIGKVAEYFSRSMNSTINACSPYALSSRRSIHSSAPKDVEKGMDFRSMDFGRGVIEEDRRGGGGSVDFVKGVIEEDRRGGGFQFPPKDVEKGMDFRSMDFGRGVIEEDRRGDGRSMDFVRGVIDEDRRGGRFQFPPKDVEKGMDFRSMNFVRGVIEEDRRGGGFRFPRTNVDHDVDIVHIKLMRNNTFVTVTDAKGNKKIGASSGSLSEMKGKGSKYASEATAEHVGRLSRNMGLKSVVMRVKGFTYFKKKRQAIISWREGFTNSKVERNQHSPVVYIEDATRKPHNGCRLPRQRRV